MQLDLQVRAALAASDAHRGQRYGDKPYMSHLEDVVRTLKQFGVKNEDVLAAGFLHDAIEDTDMNYNDIRRATNESVAEIVFAVTDELGRNRAERARNTYPKIRGYPQATAVKLADRIANVSNGHIERSGMVAKYMEEYGKFKEALFVVFDEHDFELNVILAVTSMWQHLDRLMRK